MISLSKVYQTLLKKYYYQGWWPLIENNKINYHKKDYSFPKTKEQEFEICVGVILTQNTSWKNAEKSLLVLYQNNLLNPQAMINNNIIQHIKSSGYYNQKAEKLKRFAKLFLEDFDKLKFMSIKEARKTLLSINGIGNESADSILLYVLKKPIFVIDSYTKRLFSSLNLNSYESLQGYFHNNLPLDYKLFNEFHALIVRAGKDKLEL